MKHTLLFLVATLCFASVALAQTKFEYGGVAGPCYWDSLDPAYSACNGAGGQESPIDLPSDLEQHHKHKLDLRFHETDGKRYSYLSDGETLKFLVANDRSVFTIDDEEFVLRQFHFHSPSEHHVDGYYFPLEQHMVFQAEDGDLAVIGTLFSIGEKDNKFLDQFWDLIPKRPDEEEVLSSKKEISFDEFSESVDTKRYFNYIGSLTTPPCS